MKIERVEPLHADGVWRNFDFLKITTDTGIVGWSEYNESFGGHGVTAMIRSLTPILIGQDARRYEAISAWLYARGRTAQGGVTQQAIAAIENALIDIKARALGIPVYELFGGPIREKIRLYWSHCGTYRVWGERMGIPTVKTLRRHHRARQGSRRQRIQRAQDQRAAARRRRPARAQRRLRARRRLSRPQRRPLRARRVAHRAGRLPGGRRQGHGHPGGPELELQDRRASSSAPAPWSPTTCSGSRSTRAMRARSPTSATTRPSR